MKNNYIKKFQTSIDFWHNVGGGLEEKTIAELLEHGYHIQRNGFSNYTVMKLSRVNYKNIKIVWSKLIQPSHQ